MLRGVLHEALNERHVGHDRQVGGAVLAAGGHRVQLLREAQMPWPPMADVKTLHEDRLDRSALLFVSFSAMADGATYQYPQVMSPNLTRAQVEAQTDAAAARSELVSGELSYVAPAQGSSLSRSAVSAEFSAARAKNELPHGEFAFGARSQG